MDPTQPPGPGPPPRPRAASPLDRPVDALGHGRARRRHDRERPADLRSVRAFREPRRPLPPEPLQRRAVPRLEPDGRLARRGPQLALYADVAPRGLRTALSVPPGRERRVARSLVPAAGRARGDRDAEVLFGAP